jgi:hypothetical protein
MGGNEGELRGSQCALGMIADPSIFDVYPLFLSHSFTRCVQECCISFHPLCMLNHPDKFYSNDFLESEDIDDNGKEYFCPRHSIRKKLEAERKKLREDGESTVEVDEALAEMDLVIVQRELPSMSKLVSVIAPSQGGKRKKRVVEYSATDQPKRAAEYEAKTKEIVATKMEMAAKAEEDALTDEQRKLRRIQRLAGDRTGIDSSESDNGLESDGESKPKKLKRMRKLGDIIADGVKIEPPAAAASVPHFSIDPTTNPTIEARSSVRRLLDECLAHSASASAASASAMDSTFGQEIEEAIYAKHGRVAGAPYKLHARDLVDALQRNDPLRTSVLQRSIVASDLAAMTNAQMAVTELKRQRRVEHKEAVREVIAIVPEVINVSKLGRQA